MSDQVDRDYENEGEPMSKHTPGPWKWSPDNEILTSFKGEEVLRALAFYDLSAEIDVFDADARLIAAAPDLLEALQKFVGAWSGSVVMSGTDEDDKRVSIIKEDTFKALLVAADEAREAITKATGVE